MILMLIIDNFIFYIFDPCKLVENQPCFLGVDNFF